MSGLPSPAGDSPQLVRVDLHCHSSASDSATPPSEVYEVAKRHGMDFVTITDHDTLDGVLQIADEPDVFLSEELTAWFRDEPQAVHVLCLGVTPEDHEWLQAHSRDVIACAEYMHDHEIACALAHPFWDVAAPLAPAHRRKLADLFPVWETRNGKRSPELNAPAAIYVETHGGIAVAGSDDHAGVDIGRTYTEAPPAATVGELLEHIRRGRVSPHGKQGTVAKSAHATLAAKARALGSGTKPSKSAFLRAWLREMDLDLDAGGLLAMLQAPQFSHSDLERRARRVHERKLTTATRALVGKADKRSVARLFASCVPAIPYVPAAAAMARERAGLTTPADDDPVSVAVVADPIPGVTRVVRHLRERAIQQHEVDVIGTGAEVDHRLPVVTELEPPASSREALGVPSLFAVAEALTERRYDVVHACAPGPAGLAAVAIARQLGIPIAGSYHAEIPPQMAQIAGVFYGQCSIVLSPSRTADETLLELGVAPARMVRWEPGVDLECFHPARYATELLPAGFNVVYSGSLSAAAGIDLLAEAFLIAHDRERRLRLVLAGRGPAEQRLRQQLGPAGTFLGWVDDDALAELYASADLFVLPGPSDAFGASILEAQATGLPVLAVAGNGSADLIESGRSGCIVPAEPDALAGALRGLARRGAVRDRLATGGLLAARERTWDRSLTQLAGGWSRALGGASSPEGMARAA